MGRECAARAARGWRIGDPVAGKTETSAQVGQAVHAVPARNRLGPFLCWAVVFADIGTSVYYVPGILYGQYGRLAGLFVILTLSVFVLLTLKYAEVTARFPEGGGVVTVASRAIGPWAGALGGMLILVDYFLTASLSSLSGLTYFQVVAPGLAPWVLWGTVGVLVVLGLLNWWGIKESASVSAAIAVLALVIDLTVLAFIFARVPLPVIGHTFTEMFSGRLRATTLLTGFAGSFLAFSGLESISQLSPVMRVPRRRVAGWALALVVMTVGITSPLLTVFSTTLLCQRAGHEPNTHVLTCVTAPGKPPVDPNQFISALGSAYGGPWLGILVAISASALLVFASNTAIIGSYHVFLALTRMRFFPPIVGRYNHFRETPHVAILLATGIPVVILVAVQGRIILLGDLYAFGLLGAFTLTALGLDIVRLRERRGSVHIGPTQAEEDAELRAQERADASAAQRPAGPLRRTLAASREALRPWATQVRATVGARRAAVEARLAPLAPVARRVGSDVIFGLGILTTALVALAWCVNIVNKPLATEFGGGVTLIGLAIAWVNHRQQVRAGRPAVHPRYFVGYNPDALLVLLPVGPSEAARRAREAVVRAAAEHADGRPLVLLYLAPAGAPVSARILEITDPYTRDLDAQQAFSQAEMVLSRLDRAPRAPEQASRLERLMQIVAGWLGITRRKREYVYRVGKVENVADVWRNMRPEAIVAQADQGLARTVQPGYVRFQDVDGVRVAFYVRPAGGAAPGPSGSGGAGARQGPEAAPVQRPAGGRNGRRATPAPAGNGGRPTTRVGAPRAGAQQAEEPQQLPPMPRRNPSPARGALPRAGEEAQRVGSELDAIVPPGSLEEADRYVWTGTELKRRDELEGAKGQDRDAKGQDRDERSAQPRD
jgi:amino acid transporter